MTKKDKDKFWSVVKDCMVTIHGSTPRSSSLRIRGARNRLKRAKVEYLIYHDCPLSLSRRLSTKYDEWYLHPEKRKYFGGSEEAECREFLRIWHRYFP